VPVLPNVLSIGAANGSTLAIGPLLLANTGTAAALRPWSASVGELTLI